VRAGSSSPKRRTAGRDRGDPGLTDRSAALYWAGAALGQKRLRQLAERTPLVEVDDLDAPRGGSTAMAGRPCSSGGSSRWCAAWRRRVERMPLLRFIIYTTVGQPTRPGRPCLCGPVADQTRGRPSWPAAESPASSSPGRPGTGEEACGGCGLTARRHSPLVGTRPRWLLHAVSGTGCRWLVLAATLVTPRARRVRLHPRRATSPATGLALAAGTGSRAARGGRRPPAPPSHR